MKTVVVLGGYGAFGARIVRGLVDQELGIVVAGRDPESAERTVAELGDQRAALTPMVLDVRAEDFPSRLAALAPWLVIDTCGPFQSRDHAVARAWSSPG